MNALELSGVTVRFGGLVAVNGLSFSVQDGAIHSLIGPNGAGKSTVINTITGLYAPTEGAVRVAGRDTARLRPDQIACAGVARSFQNTEMFGEMTVIENILIGAHRQARHGLFASALRLPSYFRGEAEMRRRADELLEMLGLGRDRDTLASALPFGKQRQLELARALASSPKLLLLDEPAAGLRSAEIDHLNRTLVRLRDEHRLTILLVDHVMKVVMNISDRITVLNFGQKIAEGTPAEVRADPEVRRAYLGDRPDRARAS
ncbi:ABC transporter ATP-binding protein [Enterovirga sp.]|jgi:branched-chain amino acid transport system ATP-binding protein|uniref:ABC transporter ATP-binding protein n=1 Tax=Enterovirga sp. TaxID=2026350 RepID=UPI00262CE271|nr:ABC transporter ATP-binding protein [Enterovirga sp.]MDB5591179.1 livG [Enterovirga sp.]